MVHKIQQQNSTKKKLCQYVKHAVQNIIINILQIGLTYKIFDFVLP